LQPPPDGEIMPSCPDAVMPGVGAGTEQKVEAEAMIRKLASGKYRLYSRKKDPKTGRRRNLGTFSSRAAAERHERAVQFFKRH
jgi:hypothetical protein